jgi:small GTP-binding protein
MKKGGKKKNKKTTNDSSASPSTLSLPDEVHLRVFQFLGVGDLCRVSLVCRQWSSLASDDKLWKGIYLYKWLQEPPPSLTTTPQALGGQQATSRSAGTDSEAPPPIKNWKLHFMRRMAPFPRLPYSPKPLSEADLKKIKSAPPTGIRSVKCVILGDTGVGKTCLAISYTTESFPGDYVPNVMDQYSANVMIHGYPVNLEIWDTAGDVACDSLRRQSYADADVFLLCFSIVDPASLWALIERFRPEVEHHAPSQSKFLLVGTKLDLLLDSETPDGGSGSGGSGSGGSGSGGSGSGGSGNGGDVLRGLKARGLRPVSNEEGSGVAQQLLGAWQGRYLPCSALTQEGLKHVFDTAVIAGLTITPKPKQTDKCCLQ